jgi:hypothetical protein
MSGQSRSALKNYFLTGNVPTQSNFADLIDSFINEADDQVYMDLSHNMGLGIATPPARLAIAGAAAEVMHAFTLTVTTGSDTATATVMPGMSLPALVYPGDMIQLPGNTQLFSVLAVTAQSLQLSPVPTADAANVQVTLLRNQLYIGNATTISNANTQMVLTNAGNLGLGVLQPQQMLHVNGNVLATGFIGNGSQLTNLAAASLTGQLPLAALPALSFTNIQGQLAVSQLPAGYQPVVNGITGFNCSTPIVQSGSSITLSWTVNNATSLQLTYLNNYAITTANSATNPAWLPSGSFTFTPDISQTFTLTAYKDNTALNTAQLTITVIPNGKAFMQNSFTANVPATTAVANAGKAFNLGVLCASNVTLLAAAMNNVYTNADIYRSIPAYYISLGFTWSPVNNGPWIDHVLYPS